MPLCSNGHLSYGKKSCKEKYKISIVAYKERIFDICLSKFTPSWNKIVYLTSEFQQIVIREFNAWHTILPYFGKRKQVTYHPNLSYWCFHNSHNELFFQAKFHAETLILLRDIYVRYDIMIFHWRQCKWQTHFALLREMSLLSLASFCQIRAILVEPIFGWNDKYMYFRNGRC